jgi:hypothetical protein
MQQLEINFSATVTHFERSQQVVAADQPTVTPASNPVGDLWRRVAGQKQKLAAMRQQLDSLLQWLDREIADDRAAVAEAMTELTERLLQHMGRRSLAQWQRLELAIWVLDNIESLDGFGRDTQMFKKTYQTLFSQFYEPPEETPIDDDEDWLSRVFSDLQGDDIEIEDAVADVEDVAVDEPDPDPDAGDYRSSSRDSPAPSAKVDEPLSDAFLTRLFRRTAKVLHPDLADNEADRLRNDGLMKTLLRARREQDVATLFEMYFEYVGDPDVGVGAADLDAMQALLQRQLQQLQRETDQLSDQTPLHRWVVDNLLERSERDQRRALGRMRAELDEMGRQARAICRRVRTLASLKPVLAERHDARLFS